MSAARSVPPGPAPADLRARLAALEAELFALRIELARERRDGALPPGVIEGLRCTVEGLGEVVLAGPIDEVVQAASLTLLPEAPPWIAGLLDRRGALVPVIDPAARWSGARRPLRAGDRFVLGRDGARPFGVLVEETFDIQRFEVGALGRVPEDFPFARYLLGAAPGRGARALVLSLAGLAALAALPEERP